MGTFRGETVGFVTYTINDSMLENWWLFQAPIEKTLAKGLNVLSTV